MYRRSLLRSILSFVLIVSGMVSLANHLAIARGKAQDIDATHAELWDVVETHEGSVWKGVIVETVPNERYRVALPGGSIVVVNARDVVRISKSRNPNYVPASSQPSSVAPSQPSIHDGLPLPLATAGARVSFSPGVAVPMGSLSDGLGASFLSSFRGGHEFMFGRFGFTPSFRLDAISWRVNRQYLGTAQFVHIGTEGRLAAHFRRIVPYIAIGVGADVNVVGGVSGGRAKVKSGFGMDATFGADILLTKSFALGVGFDVHPALVRFYGDDSPKVGFFGTLFSLSYYG